MHVLKIESIIGVWRDGKCERKEWWRAGGEIEWWLEVTELEGEWDWVSVGEESEGNGMGGPSEMKGWG